MLLFVISCHSYPFCSSHLEYKLPLVLTCLQECDHNMLNPGSLRLVRKYPWWEERGDRRGHGSHLTPHTHEATREKNMESDKSATSTQCWLGSDAFLAGFAVMLAWSEEALHVQPCIKIFFQIFLIFEYYKLIDLINSYHQIIVNHRECQVKTCHTRHFSSFYCQGIL